MISPKGEVLHQNLMTAYTDISQLITTLIADNFAGTVEIEYPEGKGVFFVANNEILNAEVTTNDGNVKLIGDEATKELFSLSGQKNGVINVYRLSANQVEFIAVTLKAEAIYKGLSTDFILLDKLIAKMKEEKLYGFIEIFSKELQPMGVLFLKNGELIEMFIISETGPSFFFDQKSIPAFLENVLKKGAILNVYRSLAKMATPPPLQETKESDVEFGDMIIRDEGKLQQGVEEITREEVEIIVEDAEEEKEKPPKLEEETPVNVPDGNGIREFIQIFQEVISKVEKFVDGISQKGTFLRTFKTVLIDRSDIYHFLDPFVGQFEYREGKILLQGDIDIENFVKGVGDSFNVTIAQLKKEFPNSLTIPLGLKAEIDVSMNKYQDAARRYGLNGISQITI